MQCSFLNCGAKLKPGFQRCPSCKRWNLAPAEDDDDTVLLSNAKLSGIERIPTQFLNSVFGGGIATTSVNLFGGPPGAGKTTLFLQLCDEFAELFPTREIVYIANEQEAAEIKETAKRIQIVHLSQIRIVKAMGGLKRPLQDILQQYKPCLTILDSLTKLVGEDMALGVTIAEAFKAHTVELRSPCLIVNQINKAGDMAGMKKLEHAVDATFMLEKDDEDGSRFLYSTKNRFGESPKGVELRMTPEDSEVPGKLVLVSNEEEDEEDQ
jgi:DNA repair protein RadA/Sms